MPKLVRALSARDLGPGACRLVELDGRALAIYNVDGAFYATDNACAHQGGPLAEGLLDGATVLCPWHGWPYDVRTGACALDPRVRIATYPVRVEGDDVFVEL